MRIIFLTIIITSGVYFSSCQSNQNSSNPNEHKVVVAEVLQANEYTYLRVNENDKELWLAVSKMEAQINDTYYYEGGFTMTDFKSKDLNRTFKEVLFLDNLSKIPIAANKNMNKANTHGNAQAEQNITPQKPKIEKKEVVIEHNNGEISIAKLFQNKEQYVGKTIKVKGKVVKFSPEIMSKNWIHLQDGTDFEGKFDLTITTNIVVKVDDIVTLEGKICVDKDFGYGYFYEVLLEDAIISK